MGRCSDIGKTTFIVHCIEDKLECKNEGNEQQQRLLSYDKG